jgi:hypothetical protein
MEAEPVQHAMLDLMIALGKDIVAYEAMANELVKTTDYSLDQRGAAAMRDTAVRQRVRALEMRGRLAALHEEYITRFGSEP